MKPLPGLAATRCIASLYQALNSRSGASRQRFLRHALSGLGLFAALFLTRLLYAAPESRPASSLLDPQRITAGDADELLGKPAPNGLEVYFQSNAESTWQIYVQNLRSGAPRLVFDNTADAEDPQVSPDGSRLLYLSYREDAGGDVCIRGLTLPLERCLTELKGAQLQTFWYPDSRHVGVVSRADMHSDFVLLKVNTVDGQSTRVLDQNLANPALSPDGRWLAYVPLERETQEVGVHFARRVDRPIELLQLEGGGAPQRLSFPLSGVSGFPAFSLDGTYLYFSQYLNDTNLDGTIDGDDHSVLFRVPFEGKSKTPVRPDAAVQLTSATWNCQFPAPSPKELIATCERQGSLDLYRLPLTGSVPPAWSSERLDEELRSSRDPWQRLLLLAHLLTKDQTAESRLMHLREMIRWHLELREYESAEFYITQIEGMKQGAELAPAMHVLRELIAFRRDEQRLSRGEIDLLYQRRQRERIARLTPQMSSPGLSTLTRLVVSEIYEQLGERGLAVEAIEPIHLVDIHEPFELYAFGAYVPSMYRRLQRNEAELDALTSLALHASLPTGERLAFANACSSALERGKSPQEARRAIDRLLPRVPPGSELEFTLLVRRPLLTLTPSNQEEVRAELFELYKANKDLERRKALVSLAVSEASRRGCDALLYEFANSWVSYLKREQAERAYAEMLYREVLLERAYVSLSEGDIGDARGYAYGLTRQVASLEAHILFMEAWVQEQRGPVLEQYDKQYKEAPEDPVYQFVRGYQLLKQLPILSGEAMNATVAEARPLLEAAVSGLPRDVAAHHALAYLHHFVFLRTQDTEAAMEASARYQLALDLARENPRYQAVLLQGLGLLHAAVDSHRLAVDCFEQRLKLPPGPPVAQLALLLATSRSHIHVGKLEEASNEAESAMALLLTHGELAHYRALVLNQVGLTHYLAGELEAAERAYEALEVEVLGYDQSAEERRTRIKVGLVAAAVKQAQGRHEEALEAYDQVARWLEDSRELWPEDNPKVRANATRIVFGREEYRLLLLGLRAQSLMALKRHEEALALLLDRREAYKKRFKESDLDEDLLELATTCHHLASQYHALGQDGSALEAIEAGLDFATRHKERTGSPVTEAHLMLLRDYAELRLYGTLPKNRFRLEVQSAMEETLSTLSILNSQRYAEERFLFPIYLTLFKTE